MILRCVNVFFHVVYNALTSSLLQILRPRAEEKKAQTLATVIPQIRTVLKRLYAEAPCTVKRPCPDTVLSESRNVNS